MNAPTILFFSWNRSDQVRALRHLPARIVVPDSIDEISDASIAACLFVVSREAMLDPTFTEAVRACLNELGTRREFRVFVHLSGITKQNLLASAESIPAAADLLDSVHIGDSSEEGEFDRLVDNLETHLQQLPAILDYAKFEQWKRIGAALVPLLTLGYAVTFGLSSWMLTARPKELPTSDWLPWILASIAVMFYSSFLAIASFGSTFQGGALFRWAIALYPLWIINSIPSTKLVANWRFLLVGFGAGIALDSIRRMWAATRRLLIPLTKSDAEPDVSVLGRRRWQMLTTAPLLGIAPRVFISYSRASVWGSHTAAALHEAIQSAGVSSFLDADGIAEGTSWRHKLQYALGKATVFIAVQDALTASRHWPIAEMKAAIASQAYCGLPSIIIVCDPLWRKQMLIREHETDPTLLRIIDFKPETPRNLAQGLVTFEPASVVNPALSQLLDALLAPVKVGLALIGSLGPLLVFVVASTVAACRIFGSRIRIDDWIVAHGFAAPCMIFAAFLLGFIIRLAFASRFEQRPKKNAPHVLWIHLWAALGLLWLQEALYANVEPLTVFGASVVAGFGFLLACDFVSRTLPQRSLP